MVRLGHCLHACLAGLYPQYALAVPQALQCSRAPCRHPAWHWQCSSPRVCITCSSISISHNLSSSMRGRQWCRQRWPARTCPRETTTRWAHTHTHACMVPGQCAGTIAAAAHSGTVRCSMWFEAVQYPCTPCLQAQTLKLVPAEDVLLPEACTDPQHGAEHDSGRLGSMGERPPCGTGISTAGRTLPLLQHCAALNRAQFVNGNRRAAQHPTPHACLSSSPPQPTTKAHPVFPPCCPCRVLLSTDRLARGTACQRCSVGVCGSCLSSVPASPSRRSWSTTTLTSKSTPQTRQTSRCRPVRAAFLLVMAARRRHP